MIYVGMDDTDILGSRGTGRLARDVATALSLNFRVFGVTRHQLLVHPDIPFTSHNSCAVIHLDAPKHALNDIFEAAKKVMLNDFIKGSDPGLTAAFADQISPSVIALGQDAKTVVLTQERAFKVAENCKIRLESLGGTGGGVIGALAGVGLASGGNDGRFLLRGRNRELTGTRSVQEILEAGIDSVMTLQGETVVDKHVRILKNATPSLIQGKAVLFVGEIDGCLTALKRA